MQRGAIDFAQVGGNGGPYGLRSKTHTENEGAASENALQKTATVKYLRDCAHARLLVAACLIAARMRMKHPQRQMLPDISLSISASVIVFFLAISAAACM